MESYIIVADAMDIPRVGQLPWDADVMDLGG